MTKKSILLGRKKVFYRRCDGAYHCYCLQSTHKIKFYLCSKHARCHSCGSNVPGNGLSVRWFMAYTNYDACGRLFTKGNYCPVFLKVSISTNLPFLEYNPASLEEVPIIVLEAISFYLCVCIRFFTKLICNLKHTLQNNFNWAK